MPFFECEFPRDIAFQASGGDCFSTLVNEGFSGYEQRNRNWAFAKAEYQVSLDHKPLAYYQMAMNFFRVVGGRADAFRLLDPLNYRATNQACAQVADSPYTGCVFQLQVTYSVGSRSYVRTVVKPITSAVERFDGTFCEDTVSVRVLGASVASGWTLDHTTGRLTFAERPAAIPTASFQFHIPVRFDTDKGKAIIEESDVADGEALVTWPGVDLKEVPLLSAGAGSLGA